MQRRGAFTLVELLVVVAILALLAALLIPSLGNVRASAQARTCTSNVRQLGVACMLYANDHDGEIAIIRNSPAPLATWQDLIHDEGYLDGIKGVGRAARELDVFYCPARSRASEVRNPGRWRQNGVYSMNGVPSSIIPAVRTRVLLAAQSAPATRFVIGEPSLDHWASGQWYHMLRSSELSFPHDGQIALAFLDGHASLVASTNVMPLPSGSINPNTTPHFPW